MWMFEEKGSEELKNYTFLGRSDGRRFCIEGIDVFTNKWQSQGVCDIIMDPEDKMPYSFSVYQIVTNAKTITFSAGKFQDEMWGFYQLPNE